jgi:2'-hydroxyisoflavone reductase
MRLLLLGGSRFLGRHLADLALTDGHTVSMLNRGRHAADVPAEVELLRAERGSDLAILVGRSWNAVIDTSGYLPADLTASCRRLVCAVDHYVFVSTLSVYPAMPRPGMDETTPVFSDPVDGRQVLGPRTYGPLKAASERVVCKWFGQRATIARLGQLFGPYDYSGRVPYWLRRASLGSVVCPGDPARPVQLVDVRDCAVWLLSMAALGHGGTFHVTGPPVGFGEFLRRCGQATGTVPEIVAAKDELLAAARVLPGVDLPLYLPGDQPEQAGFYQVSTRQAEAAGLRARPLAVSLADTYMWMRRSADVVVTGMSDVAHADLVARAQAWASPAAEAANRS